MIDLHCHLLPGVDDGPAAAEESVAIARAAARDGVGTIVATPHRAEEYDGYHGDEAETRGRIDALQSELSRRGVELEILPGLEVFLTPEVPDLYARGRLFGLNSSRYMLVEFPAYLFPPYAEDALFELQLRGLVPVVAHPERNSAIAAKPEILQRLVDRGMLAQVTAGSLVGRFGSRIRSAAETMLLRGLVQVIASDAHSAEGRSPCLSVAAGRAAELVGREAAQAMVTIIPGAILRDEEVEMPRLQPVRRRSWFPFHRGG